MTAPALDDLLAETLAAEGVVVLDGWLGVVRAAAVRAEILGLRAAGRFGPSGVGAGARASRTLTEDIRRDQVCWFQEAGDPADAPGEVPGAEVRHFLVSLAGVIAWLNRTCFLSIGRSECHATSYDDGAFYRAHLDTFAADPHRLVSYCYYLNPAWTVAAGGCLRIHGEPDRDLAPLSDRLVLFRSATVRHEVLPVLEHRLSLTGWLTPRTRG